MHRSERTPDPCTGGSYTVVWGANNIYTLRNGDGALRDRVRIKGKLLEVTENEYCNVLVPGDVVELDSAGELIQARVARRNVLKRWNPTRKRVQAIAANVNRVLVVTAPRDPPYRPGFVARVLAMAEIEGVPAIPVLTKSDLARDPLAERDLSLLRAVGYQPRRISSVNAALADIAQLTARGTTVMIGQSGVGKSSCINALAGSAVVPVGALSHAGGRGRHTTTLARAVHLTHGHGVVVDTPGIREFLLAMYAPTEIAYGFREFQPLIPDCRMPSCLHVHEPGCAVLSALAGGAIAPERYDRYRSALGDPEIGATR